MVRCKRGEIGDVIEPRIYLNQAAILSRQVGPPLWEPSFAQSRSLPQFAKLLRRIDLTLHFFPSLECAAFDPGVCDDLMRRAQTGSDRLGAKGLLHIG
jgi:hypothetical protein